LFGGLFREREKMQLNEPIRAYENKNIGTIPVKKNKKVGSYEMH
jgi:hypothetical protein